MSAAATRVPRLDRGVRRSSRNRLKINFASPAVGTGACFLELGRRCRPRLRTSLRSASSASSALELFWRLISGDVGRARIDRRRPGGASCSRRALSDVVARRSYDNESAIQSARCDERLNERAINTRLRPSPTTLQTLFIFASVDERCVASALLDRRAPPRGRSAASRRSEP